MNLNTVDISKLPADVRKQFKQLQVLHAEKKIQNKAKNDFLSFVKCVWPEFVEGSHHRHIADKFNKLASGEINRLIINMPPRHTKSEFASYLLPAWMVGRDPKLKIIQATHTGELAIRFGRKAKNLIEATYKDEKKQFQPEEISSMILVKMKEIGESFTGKPVKDAVVTVVYTEMDKNWLYALWLSILFRIGYTHSIYTVQLQSYATFPDPAGSRISSV